MTVLRRIAQLSTLAALACAAALPDVAWAQQPAPKRPAPTRRAAPAPAPPAAPATPAAATVGSIAGVVTDSIHGRPLAGATIVVDGTPRVGESDTLGRFRIDSVPPGEWRLALFHPLLDTIGVAISTQPIPFAAGTALAIELGVPSVATLAATRCAPAARRLGPGALLGRVIDAEASDGVTNARVSLVFEEMTGIPGIAMRPAQRVRTATTDAAGRFSLCGLPESMKGTLQVERSGTRTPEIAVVLDETGHAMHTVLFAASAPAAVAGAPASGTAGTPAPRLRGTATLRGRVASADKRPVAGARVSVEGTGAETTTDAAGTFTLTELPAGTWTVLARRVGARPEPQVVSLPPRRVTEVALVLQAMTELETVVIRDTVAQGLARVGFSQRRNSGMGHYLTPEQIAQRRAERATDLLRTLPGLLITPDARGRQTIRGSRNGGQGCVAVFIDGTATMDGNTDLDAQMPASEVAAVEVYSDGNVPAEFTRPGRGSCGAIVLWTKTRTRQQRR